MRTLPNVIGAAYVGSLGLRWSVRAGSSSTAVAGLLDRWLTVGASGIAGGGGPVQIVPQLNAHARAVAADAQVRRLREVYGDLAAASAPASTSTGDTLGPLRAKDAFYAVLLEGAASPVLTWTLTGLQSRVRLLRQTSFSVPGRVRQSLAEIHTLLCAIEARDPDAAAEVSATHIRNAARIGLARMSHTPPP